MIETFDFRGGTGTGSLLGSFINVSLSRRVTLASPKSVSLTCPSLLINTLSGFKSR